MDSTASPQRTIGQSLNWLNIMMFYTDEVCKSVPEAELDARFTDPEGHYFFSARELMMHMADSRWNVLAWIDGSDPGDRKFQLEFGGKEKPWKFKDGATKEEILGSLAESRAAIDELLGRPESDALLITAALQQSHDKRIAAIEESGKDTAELAQTGPSNIANVLLFLAAHEQAHRGELQWLMRTRGAPVFRYT